MNASGQPSRAPVREWRGGESTVERGKATQTADGALGPGLLARQGGDRRVEEEEARGSRQDCHW